MTSTEDALVGDEVTPIDKFPVFPATAGVECCTASGAPLGGTVWTLLVGTVVPSSEDVLVGGVVLSGAAAEV